MNWLQFFVLGEMGKVVFEIGFTQSVGCQIVLCPCPCSLCKSEEEKGEHLFYSSAFLKSTWDAVMLVVGVTVHSMMSFIGVYVKLEGIELTSIGAVMWWSLPQAIIWPFWLEQNHHIIKEKISVLGQVLVRALQHAWEWN